MNELNEKLARWAGFKYQSRSQSWTSPDKLFDMRLPDFAHSLDACFKWLVPKLGHVGLSTQGCYFDVTIWAKDTDSEYDGIMTREATPTLALCKAIEKLIDAETK